MKSQILSVNASWNGGLSCFVLFCFPVTVTLTSDLVSRIGITSIFVEVGIPRCFLGWPKVAYHFWVTVTFTCDLVFRIIMFGAFFLYYLS